jgi:hypothetical protein
MKRLAILLALVAVPAVAQVSGRTYVPRTWAAASLPTCTATLSGWVYEVYDAATASDCTTGGSTLKHSCQCDGTTWQAIPRYTGASLGIGTVTPNKLLELNAAADPTIRLSEGGSTTSHTELIDVSASLGRLQKTAATGDTTIDIQPLPSDGTSVSQFRFFRDTNTTGEKRLDFFLGDGSGTLLHKIRSLEVTFNEPGNDIDFRVEGDTNANLLFVDAGADRVGIGTATPAQSLHVNSGRIRLGTVDWITGSGSPEGVHSAAIGSFYSRTDGGLLSSFYVKESGTGNTGWVAK